MASEILSVKEEKLGQFIDVVRTGLAHCKVEPSLRASLLQWCLEEEEYLKETLESDEEFLPTVPHPPTAMKMTARKKREK